MIRTLLIVCVMLVGVTFGQEQDSRCASKVDGVFGSKIVYDGKILYVVDDNHLLEKKFSKNCQVTEIRVGRRSNWIQNNTDNNQDSTSDLTLIEYDRLLEKINKIRPLGNLLLKDTVGVSSNQRTWLWFKFDRAFLDQSFYYVNESETSERTIIDFSILYSNVVTGTITDKFLLEEKGNFSRAKVLIDGHWYWTTDTLFSTAVLKKRGQFQVFGNAIEPGQ